jgi:hypothetical protein
MHHKQTDHHRDHLLPRPPLAVLQSNLIKQKKTKNAKEE